MEIYGVNRNIYIILFLRNVTNNYNSLPNNVIPFIFSPFEEQT